MSTKLNPWIFALPAAVCVLLFAVLSLPKNVSAAPASATVSNSCLSCHEDLYFLHDTGKYYCISEHKDRCVNCHEGNATVMDEKQAHLGLIAHPQENNGVICGECHIEDTQTRIDNFASESGGFVTAISAVAYSPSSDAVDEFPVTPEENQLVKNRTWLAGAIVLFGFWLALIFLSPQKP